MNINFNNVRKQAVFAYNSLVKKIVKSTKIIESTTQ